MFSLLKVSTHHNSKLVYYQKLIFTLDTAIPNEIFQMFKRENVVKYMKCCTEINIAFIPYEMQVD